MLHTTVGMPCGHTTCSPTTCSPHHTPYTPHHTTHHIPHPPHASAQHHVGKPCGHTTCTVVTPRVVTPRVVHTTPHTHHTTFHTPVGLVFYTTSGAGVLRPPATYLNVSTVYITISKTSWNFQTSMVFCGEHCSPRAPLWCQVGFAMLPAPTTLPALVTWPA